MSSRGANTAADVAADVLCEFLEAAVHATLQRRGLYPRDLFELRRVFGVPVQFARPPELVEYVADFVAAVRPMMRTGAAQLLSVVVTTAARVPLERHVFEFGLVGEAAAAAAALAGGGPRPPPASAADGEALPVLERLLAETLASLSAGDAWLRPLPPGALRAHACALGASGSNETRSRVCRAPLTPAAACRLHFSAVRAHHGPRCRPGRVLADQGRAARGRRRCCRGPLGRLCARHGRQAAGAAAARAGAG
jgi:hypothetical protein